jgi:RHS repeat-associated protein
MNKEATGDHVLRRPAAGGAVSGIGADFKTNLNTGTGSYSVPIELPSGYRTQSPQVSLSYSSGAGQTEFGLGWTLPVLHIRRDTRNGFPHYSDDDRFLLSGEELARIAGDIYRPLVDTTFQRVRRLEIGWEVTDRQGTRFLLGTDVASQERFPDRAGENGVLAWFVDRIIDSTDNETRYSYTADSGHLYLQGLDYAVYRMEITYEPRPDVISSRRGGFEQRTALRASRIAIHKSTLQPSLVKSYDLTYRQDPLAGHSLLTGIALSGFVFEPEAATEQAPPLRFEYTGFEPSHRTIQTFRAADSDGPPGLSSQSVDVIDLEGFGLPGVLEASEVIHRYWPNRGDGQWGIPVRVREFPENASLQDDNVRFGDMDGDGRADLLVSAGALSGFYPGEAGVTWGRLRPYLRNRPTFDARDPHVRLLDANADGRVDALVANDRGFLLYEGRGRDGWAERPVPVPLRRDDPTFPDVNFADPRVRLADMTGDGLIDIVRVYARHLEFWPNTGVAEWGSRRILPLTGPGPERFSPARCHLADVNGDGLADLVYVDGDAIYLWVNRQGASLSESIRVRYPPPATPATVRATDMLGTGTAGLLFTLSFRPGQRDPYRFLDFTGGAKPYLMSRIDNGVGKATEITYGASTRHRVRDRDAGRDWHTFLPRAVQVVDRVHHLDTVTGRESAQTFRYHNGQYDGRTQRFAGFAVVDTVEDAGPGTMLARTTSHFHVGVPGERPDVPPGRAPALRGQLFKREVFGEDGSAASTEPFQVEHSNWSVRVVATAADGRDVLFPHQTARTLERFERTALASRVLTELEHDDFGNVTRESRRGIPVDPGLGEQLAVIEGAYINDTERWILGLPTRRTLTSNGVRLDDVRMFFDEQPFGASTQGLLTRRERLALTDPLIADLFPDLDLGDLTALGYREVIDNGTREYWCAEYDASHDARGNVIEHRDAFGRVTRIDYDPDHALFPIRTTNAAGHVSASDYHPRLDTIARLVDPNGQTTTYDFTPLGRVSREIRPVDSGAFPTVEYEYRTASLPIATVMTRRRVSGAADSRRSVSYYDGSGNRVQTRARLDDGRFFVSRREVRDLRGLTLEIHRAFLSDDEAFDRDEGLDLARAYRYTYDAMRRATAVIDPAGQVARSVFGPESITFLDTQDNDPSSPFANTPRVQTIDPFGRLLRVDEQTGPETVTTSYSYDPAGRLVRVVDASGTELLAQTFDLAGRKVRVAHRDAGVRRFLYDGRGRMAVYADPAGRTVFYGFDDLGRLRTVTLDAAVVERYTYDAGAGDNLIGKVARVEDAIGDQTFSYDARGRVSSTARTVAGVADRFEYAYAYDPDDRPLRVTYPDAGVTDYTYDAMGRPASVSGLIDRIDYDSEGRRERVVYRSGLIETRTYEPALGRLSEHLLTDAGPGTELFHDRFAYDSASNVTAIEDARPPGPGVELASRTFDYDALNRMVRARGGPPSNLFDHAHEYDEIGNMTRNPPFRPEPLVYVGAQLHGFLGPGGPEELFQYDACGCMTARPGMTLTFGARDLLTRVAREDGVVVEFDYDYNGRRLRKRVRSGAGIRDTLFIGENFEVKPDGARVRLCNDPEGGATLVVVDGVDSTVLHHDYLGNVVAVRDSATGTARTVHYLPYGKHLEQAEDLGDILFAGTRLDEETGLYYMRMRYYDPLLGRFISPDPIAVTNAEEGRIRPLSLNPYSYALDNPLRFNDVNGLWTFWEGFLTIVAVALVVVATAVTFGAAGVIALAVGAAVGAIIGGITTGSVDGALTGAMLGFGIVATVLSGVYLGGLIGGAFGASALGAELGTVVGVYSAGIQVFGFIPGARQSDFYKDMLGYASWLNPWAWPGHIVGAAFFIFNAIVYAVAYTVTWGDPPEWADMSVSFEQGMIVTEGGTIRPGRAWNFGAFTTINPNDPGIQNPTDRALILRHERGHMLNNAYFGLLQAGRVGAGSSQEDSFWETLAESNTNPYVEGLTGNKDQRRRSGGRGWGDIPWWNP